MKKITAFLILLLSQPVIADEWAPTDKYLAGAFVSLVVVDIAQSVEAAEQHYDDLNPLIGDDPSKTRVVTYLVGATALTLFAADKLPEYRRFILTSGIMVEVFCINHNYKVGIRLNF